MTYDQAKQYLIDRGMFENGAVVSADYFAPEDNGMIVVDGLFNQVELLATLIVTVGDSV